MKILIVKTSALGDVVQTFPVASYLKKKFPHAQIDWLVEKSAAPLVKTHPHIDRAIVIDTKFWRKNLFRKQSWKEISQTYSTLSESEYDLVFDLQGNVKSGLFLSLVQSKEKIGFAKKSVPEWPNRFFTTKQFDPPPGIPMQEEYLSIVHAYFQDEKDPEFPQIELKTSEEEKEQVAKIIDKKEFVQKLKIMICPGSNWPNKQLSPLSLGHLLSELCDTINPFYLLIWGSEEERKFVEDLHYMLPHNSMIIEKLSLPALQNLMAKVDLLLSMDSLPLHLCITTATPAFGFFGPSSAFKFLPRGGKHGAFQGECPYGITFDKRCPKLRTCKTGACIKEVPGEDLLLPFAMWWAHQQNLS